MSHEMIGRQSIEPLRWGIIGCGSIATHAVAPAIKWTNLAQLHAVGSRELTTAQLKMREVQAKKCYGSYEELLEDDEIEAVYIGLPNGLHEEWTLAAAQAGKHILCEKSLTLNSASARKIGDACKKANVRLMEAFMYRHHPQWDIVRETIRKGTVGDVRLVRAGLAGQLQDTENHRWSAILGGGALYDVTCYAINALRMIYNCEPLTVSSLADLSTRDGVDRTSVTLLDFGHGRLGMGTGSLSTYNHQFCEIEGSLGRIIVQHPFIPGWEKTQIIVSHGMKREEIEVAGANHFLHMIEHFSMCVRNPKRPMQPGEDGYLQSLVNEAVEQAWISKRTVEVTEP